jgi:peptidoglycan/LPS O-acetylase OafA/YrhL
LGLIRFFLALSVVIYHAGGLWGFKFIHGNLAVRCFFVISGFYMALILGHKYALDRGGVFKFYKNRILRLVPAYWAFLAIHLIASFAIEGYRLSAHYPNQTFWNWMAHAPLVDSAFIALSQLFMVGHDLAFFMGIEPASGALYFTSNVWAQPIQGEKLFFNPAVWSVAVEIWFYLLAPFLARFRWKTLLAIFGASMGLRLVVHEMGLNDDQWNYRFFPTELNLFVLGMLVNHVYFRFKDSFTKWQGWTALTLFLATVIGSEFLPMSFTEQNFFFPVLTALCLPFVFALTKNDAKDRFIGEFSYPLYLCGTVVFASVSLFDWGGDQEKHLAIIFFSICASVAMNLLVERPVERFRQVGLPREPVAEPASETPSKASA